MDPPWLQAPLSGNKRKTTDSSPSPSRSNHTANGTSQSKKTKLNVDDSDGEASPMSIAMDKDERETQSIMLADGFEQVMSRDAKRKMKKASVKEAQKAKKPPTLNYATAGFRSGKNITIASVRDLVEHLVTGSIPEPNWMKVENRSSVDHVVALFIPGLLPTHLGLPSNTLKPSQILPFPLTPPPPSDTDSTSGPPKVKLPQMAKLFSNALPTRAPGDQYRFHPAVNTFLSTVVPQKEKERRNREKQRDFKRRVDASGTNNGLGEKDAFEPVLFLLTPNQMIENEYPIPTYFPVTVEAFMKGDQGVIERGNQVFLPWQDTVKASGHEKGSSLPEGWKETKRADKAPEDGKYPVLAVDCEMCMTTKGDELTRVTAIDYATGKVVYDELVKPEGTVVDYKTQWSGITEEILSKATLSLSDVQTAFLTRPDLITPSTILLGHSLENDLLSMKIRHPLVIDTAILFPHAKGRPSKPSLKFLTGKWLGREIQNKGGEGHDSEEDARACLDLLRRKCIEGPEFGETMEDMETIFEKFTRHARDSKQPGRSSLLCDYGNATTRMRATRAFVCKDDDEVVENLVENVEDFDFTFARLFELSNAQKWTTPRANDSKPLGVIEPEVEGDGAVDIKDDGDDDDSATDLALSQLNGRLVKIHAALPPRTVLIIMTGNGDPRPAVRLNDKRKAFEFKYKKLGESGIHGLPAEDKWTGQDERDLQEAVMQARFGMAFFCVKNAAPGK